MFIFVLAIHILVAILIIVVILMQSGRGGGLTETFSSSMESIFGTKTNVFLIRATSVLAVLFLITCLSLAYLSTKQGKSLIKEQPVKITEPESDSLPVVVPGTQETETALPEIEETIEEQQEGIEDIESAEQTEKEE